ncbi:MAG: class I SAM-dependent methyltransferase [Gaiellaceae bacterium]
MTNNDASATVTSVRDLVAHYADYYEADESLAEWRRICAVDKAANVERLWNGRPLPSVAEIGCGDGAIMEQLRRNGFSSDLTGYEISPTGVTACQQAGFPCELVDGSTIPAADKQYDLAVLSHVVEHLAAPRELIAESARIADYIFVEVPLELNARTAKHFVWNHVGHMNLYSPLVIRHLLESCGLSVVGERVTQPSLAVCRYRLGRRRGTVLWAAKRALLAARVGRLVCTYNGSLLAKSS